MGRWSISLVVSLAALATLACGGGDPSNARERPAAPAIEACALLTAEEVATVLPGHGGGVVAPREGAFDDGVDAFQCSYTEPAPGLHTFEVILNVAVDEDHFDRLRPSRRAMENARELDVADAAWLRDFGGALVLTVLKGRTRIDLDLRVADGAAKADALVALARAVAAEVE